MGDFNIDIRIKGREYEKFEDFCILFNLSNLIKTETCFSKNHKSTIDLFSTNKANCFQHTYVTETGFSYFHKMICTVKITRLKPRKVYYRNYKNFDKSSFLLDLKSTNLDSPSIDPDENYIFLTNQLLKVVNQHGPLKVKILRANHALFIDIQLRKEIYKRGKLRNKYCKTPSKHNAALFKKQRNKCVSEDALKNISLR